MCGKNRGDLRGIQDTGDITCFDVFRRLELAQNSVQGSIGSLCTSILAGCKRRFIVEVLCDIRHQRKVAERTRNEVDAVFIDSPEGRQQSLSFFLTARHPEGQAASAFHQLKYIFAFLLGNYSAEDAS